MSKRLIKLLPLAAALALSGYASATTPKDLPSVVVKYGDLDLDTEGWRQTPAFPSAQCRGTGVQPAEKPRARPA